LRAGPRRPRPVRFAEVTAAQAANLIGKDRRTVLRLIKSGELQARQVPGGVKMPYRIDRASIDLYLKKRSDQPAN